MEPYWRSEGIGLDLLNADVMEGLRSLPAESVQCVVTSPPYWGLRDYGTAEWEGGDPECKHKCGGQVQDSKAQGAIANGVRPGCDASTCAKCGAVRVDRQLGLERTPEEYVARMVEVFRGVRRVLREDGCVWLNLGDSYANAGGYSPDAPSNKPEISKARGAPGSERAGARIYGAKANHGLKTKDLVGIPWRVAFALQADGWWLRSDIVWAKGWSFCPDRAGNCMPESVEDRPARAHEYVFLLAKSERYFYDHMAVREDAVKGAAGSTFTEGKTAVNGMGRVSQKARQENSGRNLRDVWAINTQSFPDAHFATFPEALVSPCIRAGSAARSCSQCGKPWERVYGEVAEDPRTTAERLNGEEQRQQNLAYGGLDMPRSIRPNGSVYAKVKQTLGFRPTCACYDDRYLADFPQARSLRKRSQRRASGDWWRRVRCRPGGDDWPTAPSVVLDPFGGSGTTALVAAEQGRRCVLIELSTEYCDIAVKRIGEHVDKLRAERAQLTLL